MKQVKTVDASAEVMPPEEETTTTTAIAKVDQAPRALIRAPEQPAAAAPITAAQAKVDAVANLTMKAYERAATLQLTQQELAILAREFPDEAFKPGAAGKENLIYIEHAFLRERLIEAFGIGQWALVPRNRWAEPFTLPARDNKPATEGQRVYVEAMLIVRGCFVAEAVGEMEYYPKNNAQNYGDAVEGAKTAALRRCAKELGIGLQAWKKDWCEGWWARRRGGGGQNRPPMRQGATQRPQTTPPPSQDKAPPPQNAPNPARPSQAAGEKPRFATEATRSWFLKQLADCEALAVEYFQNLAKPAVLMPNEGLADVPLEWLPITVEQMKLLKDKIAAFGNGEKASHPYKANPLKGDAPKPAASSGTAAARQAAEAAPPPKKVLPPSAEAARTKDPEWFFDVICPIPYKGMKKAEYDRNPDTIGSLYQATKQGDQEAQKRLFGFAKHYAPGPREYNGKTYQPSEGDLLFREALDAFLEWEQKHGRDTAPEERENTTAGQAGQEEERTPFD